MHNKPYYVQSSLFWAKNKKCPGPYGVSRHFHQCFQWFLHFRIGFDRGTATNQITIPKSFVHPSDARPELVLRDIGQWVGRLLPAVWELPLIGGHHGHGVRGVLQEVVIFPGAALVDLG